MKVEAIVERTDNGYYSIACDAQIGNFCLGGYGNSVEEAKADMAAIVKEAQEEYVKEHGTLPKNLQEIKIDYKYDLQSFFNYFEWINISKFAKFAGINESKMRQYKIGAAYAGEKTKEKNNVRYPQNERRFSCCIAIIYQDSSHHRPPLSKTLNQS